MFYETGNPFRPEGCTQYTFTACLLQILLSASMVTVVSNSKCEQLHRPPSILKENENINLQVKIRRCEHGKSILLNCNKNHVWCLYLLQQVGGRQCDKGPWEQWPVQFPQQSTHFPHSEVKRRHKFNMTYSFLVCIEPWLKYATEQVYCMFEQFRLVGEALHSKEI